MRRFVVTLLLTLVAVEVGARAVLAVPRWRLRLRTQSPATMEVVDIAALAWRTRGGGVVHHPRYGWMLRSGTHQPPGEPAYTVDDAGLRVLPAGRPDALRVAVFGDSYTFGVEVAADATWAGRLAPAFAVQNHGVPGYGLDQSLLRLTDALAQDALDAVVVGYTDVDLPRHVVEVHLHPKPRFEPTPDGLRLENVPVPTADEVIARHRFDVWALDLAMALATREDRDALRALGSALLDEAEARAEDAGVPLLVLELPGRAMAPSAVLDAWCTPSRRCVRTVDTLAAAGPPETLLTRSGHHTERAHTALAEALAGPLAEAAGR